MKKIFCIFPILISSLSQAQTISGIHESADSFYLTSLKEIASRDTVNTFNYPKEVENDFEKEHDLKVPESFKVKQNSDHGKPIKQNSSNIFSPIPDTSFIAVGDNGQAYPPDVSGAVGDSFLVTALNTQVRIQNKFGNVLSTVSLFSFWSIFANVTPFDPRILFDPYQHRWILTSAANSYSPNAALLIAVSSSADPTGSWYQYKINIDPNYWMDYPRVGFNNKWIVVQGAIFPNGIGSNISNYYCFDKNNLYAGGAGNYTLLQSTYGGNMPTPTLTYDDTLSNFYLVQDWASNDAGICYLRLFEISGTVGNEVLSTIAYPSAPYPWNTTMTTPQASQLNSSYTLSTNDTRISGSIYKNGKLWCIHTVFLPADTPIRSSVQYWCLDTLGNVLDVGRIDDTSGVNFYGQPSIAVNENNDALIGFSKFSNLIYASGAYSYRALYDTTFEADYVLKHGDSTYHRSVGSSSRWGDYTSTIADPNGKDIWTIQQYAAYPQSGIDRWGNILG
ncbi:MAG: hypothetical protein IPO83_17930 [Chitinophagaceae bacterium]|nr:hypothetical protein [Chitinophagaceae bacterium]